MLCMRIGLVTVRGGGSRGVRPGTLTRGALSLWLRLLQLPLPLRLLLRWVLRLARVVVVVVVVVG